MKPTKLLLICFCLFLSRSGYCLDFVDRMHTQRWAKFDINRSDPNLAPLTQKISTVVVDPYRLCFTHKLTVEEKKVAYKAMMGSIMVHNASLNDLYRAKEFKHAAYEASYQRHCAAVNEVDYAIRLLWGKFNRRESHTFQDILNIMTSRSTPYNFKYENLLTRNFVDWFYETLEEHLPERNFFAKGATPQWFDNVSRFYARNSPSNKRVFEFSTNKFDLIVDDSLNPVAVYKQAINRRGDTYARNRLVKNEYTSWLIAKAAGLTDVVNPVIPVRKTAAGFVIDPVRYDGSLEPAVGIALRNVPGALEPYGRLKSLLNGALSTCKPFCFDRDRVLFTPDLTNFSKYFYGDRFFYPPNTSESPAYANTYVPTPFPREMNFLSPAPITPAKKFEDLKLFRSAISLKHLWHVVVFWYLTEQADMNPSNILYVPNGKGEIIPTIIDYDNAFGQDGGVKYRIPLVYTLPQARETLPIGFFKTLLEFPNRKLERIIASVVDGRSLLAPLIERMSFLKSINSAPPRTLIDVMLSLMKNQEIERKYNIYLRACNIIKASVLDPVMFSGSATAEPTEKDKDFLSLVKFYGGYIEGEVCVIKGEERYVHAYKRRWVFGATAESQLEESSSDLLPVMEISGMEDQLQKASIQSSSLQYLAKRPFSAA